MSRTVSSPGCDKETVGDCRDETGASSYGTFGSPTAEKHEQRESLSTVETPSTRSTRRTNIFIYCSHFLSAWGDRMWSFGVGLFLVRIADNNLQLPAIYGLTSGLAIFVLGAVVGDWVDSTPRLKAAQLSLVAQNMIVVICAIGVYAYIRWEPAILGEPGGWAVPLCHAGVICLAVLANLASMARVIAVEKDWIVKICGSDHDMLARMTAMLRRIDQTTLIVAPAATGQVMTYASLENGALFIGAWNLVSVVLEYYLMWKVYTTVPALAYKESGIVSQEDTSLVKGKAATKSTTPSSNPAISETALSRESQPQSPLSSSPSSSPFSSQSPEDPDYVVVKTTPQRNEFSKSHRTDLVGTLVVDTEILLDESEDFLQAANDSRRCQACCGRAMHRFSVLYEGWRQYSKYTVALAGLALSFLYMTVLGFDNITVAYAVTQGVSESILGILMAVSAMFGMLGTFIYPILRRRVGLVRTGLLALSCQVSCLTLCVVSIWMPGSPFDPTYSNQQLAPSGGGGGAGGGGVLPNASTWGPSSLPVIPTATWTTPLTPPAHTIYTKATRGSPPTTTFNPQYGVITASTQSTKKVSLSTQQTPIFVSYTDDPVTSPETFSTEGPSSTLSQLTTFLEIDDLQKITISEGSAASTDTRDGYKEVGASTFVDLKTSSELTSRVPVEGPSSEPSPGAEDAPKSYVSVGLLVAGIVLARFGLWMADLSITQQFLETVKEGERGVVNGVQSSLNKLFDVLKFLLVVLIPDTETFGFLILTSFCFVCTAWVLYAVFLKRVRGHFFHGLKCGADGHGYARL